MDIVKSKNFYIREIPPNDANTFMRTWHYSGKVAPNSKLHLGVFLSNSLIGVLQYGYCMNPDSTPNSIVSGSTKNDMYELNRMAMIDSAPKNSESEAIAGTIKYIKRFCKNIKYLLSFSDGKEGNVGYIYQASNWVYIGYDISDSFYKLDNDIMHAVQVWHLYKEKHKDRDTKTTHEILYDNFKYVSKLSCKQFKYIYPLTKNIKIASQHPYPKKDTEIKILKEVILKDGIVYDEKLVIDYIEKMKFEIIGDSVHCEAGIFPYNKDGVDNMQSLGYPVPYPSCVEVYKLHKNKTTQSDISVLW